MSKKTLIAAAAGTALAASLTAPVATAASSPFVLSALGSGYQVADNHAAKPVEGKCGGKTEAVMKAKEGKCGNTAKMKDGKCGATKSKDDANKAEAGKTSTEK